MLHGEEGHAEPFGAFLEPAESGEWDRRAGIGQALHHLVLDVEVGVEEQEVLRRVDPEDQAVLLAPGAVVPLRAAQHRLVGEAVRGGGEYFGDLGGRPGPELGGEPLGQRPLQLDGIAFVQVGHRASLCRH